MSLRVRADAVADLLDPDSSPVPPDSSFLTGDGPDEIESCRSLADFLRAEEFVAILAPSAALTGERNLMIYLDRPPRHLDLEVGGERIRL